MGCKTSILECMKDKGELEKSISSIRSSLVTSDATETDKDQESLYLTFSKHQFVAEEDQIAQCKTDVLNNEDQTLSFDACNMHDDGDYLTIVSYSNTFIYCNKYNLAYFIINFVIIFACILCYFL